jgi:hypothetical protein
MLERRRYRRFIAWLPLRVTAVAGKVEPAPVTVLTRNISKSGVCFATPQSIEPGESIEIEVKLIGFGPNGTDVSVSGAGSVVWVEARNNHGWYKLAATFGEPPAGNEPSWHTLAASFDDPPPSATNP